jgi:hypothetical protein
MKTDSIPVRKMLAYIWLFSLSILIGLLFWYNDLIYSLPTPLPNTYQGVPNGKKINFIQASTAKNPIALNFYNPDCPCSCFNVAAVKRLHNKFGSKISFVIVVLSNKKISEQEIKSRFGIPVAVRFDNALAAECGVYSTPQLVLLSANNRLYYRGNYNQSRYCINEKTNYAKIAMQQLLKESDQLTLDKLALIAYGCQLPDCKK